MSPAMPKMLVDQPHSNDGADAPKVPRSTAHRVLPRDMGLERTSAEQVIKAAQSAEATTNFSVAAIKE